MPVQTITNAADNFGYYITPWVIQRDMLEAKNADGTWVIPRIERGFQLFVRDSKELFQLEDDPDGVTTANPSGLIWYPLISNVVGQSIIIDDEVDIPPGPPHRGSLLGSGNIAQPIRTHEILQDWESDKILLPPDGYTKYQVGDVVSAVMGDPPVQGIYRLEHSPETVWEEVAVMYTYTADDTTPEQELTLAAGNIFAVTYNGVLGDYRGFYIADTPFSVVDINEMIDHINHTDTSGAIDYLYVRCMASYSGNIQGSNPHNRWRANVYYRAGSFVILQTDPTWPNWDADPGKGLWVAKLGVNQSVFTPYSGAGTPILKWRLLADIGGGGFGNSAGLPVGGLMLWLAPTIPSGFLPCNGAEYEIAEFQELFDVIGDGFSNASTQPGYFNIPIIANYLIRY